jgi:hypothetical protein
MPSPKKQCVDFKLSIFIITVLQLRSFFLVFGRSEYLFYSSPALSCIDTVEFKSNGLGKLILKQDINQVIYIEEKEINYMLNANFSNRMIRLFIFLVDVGAEIKPCINFILYYLL